MLLTSILTTSILLLLGVHGKVILLPRDTDSYAPQSVSCPGGPLVRNADGLSSQESAYVTSRQQKASAALKAWLSKIDPVYSSANTLPRMALAHSGGGYRSFLLSAGVTQALDLRENNSALAGLLQGMTYQAGISGGSWFVSTMFGNDYPTVASLQKTLWTKELFQSIFVTGIFDSSARDAIANDVKAKNAAGFPVGLTDVWARLLSYQFLLGDDGGVTKTISGISASGNFTSFDVPFPILIGTGVDSFAGACLPGVNGTIYEFTPYEFGSWDPGVSAFTPMVTLGSDITNGMGNRCYSGFDNLGYGFGTSSSLFFEILAVTKRCSSNITISDTDGNDSSDPDLQKVIKAIKAIFRKAFRTFDPQIFATYPNPFFGYARAKHISAQRVLSLVDGGAADQNDPINPFIQPARKVDVLFVNDNSADVDNFPSGEAIHNTYLQAQPGNLNLNRMPDIPTPDIFLSQGLNKRPTAFGCNDASKVTIVYLPNNNYTYASNTNTLKLEYLPNQTADMIENGNAVATRNGDKDWPACLACVIMKKTKLALPTGCAACFSEYCYN